MKELNKFRVTPRPAHLGLVPVIHSRHTLSSVTKFLLLK